MKNKLTHLNDHLFAQMERLSEEGLSEDQIKVESDRAKAMVAVANKIVDTGRLALDATKFIAENGDRYAGSLPMIGKPAAKQVPNFRTGEKQDDPEED